MFSLVNITVLYVICGCRLMNRPIIVMNVAFVVWVVHTTFNIAQIVACASTRYVLMLVVGSSVTVFVAATEYGKQYSRKVAHIYVHGTIESCLTLSICLVSVLFFSPSIIIINTVLV